jgi:hypothetical protein
VSEFVCVGDSLSLAACFCGGFEGAWFDLLALESDRAVV